MNKEKLCLKNKTIKFLRFCKNFGLYNALILRYKNSMYLESTLSYYTLKNYVYCLQNKICMDCINKQNLTIDLLCDYWKEFAYNLIEEDEKHNENMKSLFEYLKNQKSIYKQIMIDSLYGNYGSDSNIEHLDYFYKLISNYTSTR